MKANRKRPLSWPDWLYYRSKRYGYSDHIQTFDPSAWKIEGNTFSTTGQGFFIADGEGRAVAPPPFVITPDTFSPEPSL